jgi:hypothetical protein
VQDGGVVEASWTDRRAAVDDDAAARPACAPRRWPGGGGGGQADTVDGVLVRACESGAVIPRRAIDCLHMQVI